ncbi:MAG: UDP-N-acetylmuramoyl-L-alanyl-D-glutamate--2,6-diaminopimelate ligase [Aliidongia sp.]|nr:UDP-N-acetylmuramoyl-L-alanyl-D-glutamate--2,6-diaminopimelate ligase [Aliidongia sp.]
MPKLIDLLDASAPAPAFNPEISGITGDSRLVQPGALFVALPGGTDDGRTFIEDAVSRGAAAIVTDPESAARLAPLFAIPVHGDANPRRFLALLAARFYATQPRIVAAVTGTNGKTSTACFTRQIWAAAGERAAAIGTLGVEGPDGLVPGSMTTPDPVALHAILADLSSAGIDHAVMEASSHGLDQYRLDGVRIAAAAFTNLTQDHLDYHGSMADYFAAKRRLFEHVLAPGGVAVLNADVPQYAALASSATQAGHSILDFGTMAQSLRLISRRALATTQLLDLEVLGRAYTVELPLVGDFQALNALAALGLAIATGIDAETAVTSLAQLSGVRGRVEKVAQLPCGASVFVDYAHTPDGLEKVLTALRPHAAGRLICIFGAGGDRDPGKRPKMGAIVAELADLAIVTDDNPRSEEPAAIRAAILAACPAALEIGDRARAIKTGLGLLQAGDVLVIAGKGHEQGQTIAGVVHPFDDAAVARAAAARLDGSR